MKKITTLFVGGIVAIYLSLSSSLVIADPPDIVNQALQNMLMKDEKERLKRDMELQQKVPKHPKEMENEEQKNSQEMERERLKHEKEMNQ